MKNKLMAAMLLLTFHINGMDKTQLSEASGASPQISMEVEGSSYDNLSIEGNDSPESRVYELNEYYQKQSELDGNSALKNLEKVFDENERKSYFEQLVLYKNDITNDQAMFEFIRISATTIINSDEYQEDPTYTWEELVFTT